MQPTSSARRALGLAAAGTIGMSTALGMAGVARADAVPTWSTSVYGPQDAVPAGICVIAWQLTGAGAGVDSDRTPGSAAGHIAVTLPAVEGQVYTLFPGGPGTDASGLTPGVGGTHADKNASVHGADGTVDEVLAGGGGGAASTVLLKRATVLQAYGADAGGRLGGRGGGGGQNVAVGAPEGFDASATTSAAAGAAGVITGTGIPCAPEAPVLQSASGGDGRLTLAVAATSGPVPVARYEYTLDGATWTPLTAVVRATQRASATITGLRNGTPYTVRVRALPVAGVPSVPSNAITTTPAPPVGAPADPVVELPSSAPPVPTTVPTSHGQLSTDAATGTSLVTGGRFTVSGGGYAPHSTITVLVYSEPQVLTTIVTDAFGAFTVEVTVPDGLRPGRHTLVASGVDALGNARTMTLPVTLSGGTTGAGGLADTGADIAVPAAGGLLSVALGGALLVGTRRRARS